MDEAKNILARAEAKSKYQPRIRNLRAVLRRIAESNNHAEARRLAENGLVDDTELRKRL